MQKILIVDDEESICEILQFNLEIEGYEADVAYSAEQALKMDLKSYSLILLDIMMGGMSGFKMAQLLKKDPATASIPIIFCTAKDTEDNKIAGLTLGADDYISKPFSVREVVARVKSVLRRCAQQPHVQAQHVSSQTEVDGDSLTYNGLRLDLLKHKCYIDGQEVQLTGRVLSREEILHNVWSDEVVVLDRTIDVNITRLRKKIGEYGKFIVTRQGYGYGFDV